jgi:prepilin-type N-terminal cleavage/methylation domain-containing protein
MIEKNSKYRRGFTLVELLVTITIIVVLAAIVFTLSSKMINNAHKAVCVTNLRGVGNALQICISERNGVLPGPLNTGQSALFSPTQARLPDKGRSLVNYIGPYMEEIKDHDAEPYMINNYGCPSLMKKVQENSVAKPAILYRPSPGSVPATRHLGGSHLGFELEAGMGNTGISGESWQNRPAPACSGVSGLQRGRGGAKTRPARKAGSVARVPHDAERLTEKSKIRLIRGAANFAMPGIRHF